MFVCLFCFQPLAIRKFISTRKCDKIFQRKKDRPLAFLWNWDPKVFKSFHVLFKGIFRLKIHWTGGLIFYLLTNLPPPLHYLPPLPVCTYGSKVSLEQHSGWNSRGKGPITSKTFFREGPIVWAVKELVYVGFEYYSICIHNIPSPVFVYMKKGCESPEGKKIWNLKKFKRSSRRQEVVYVNFRRMGLFERKKTCVNRFYLAFLAW